MKKYRFVVRDSMFVKFLDIYFLSILWFLISCCFVGIGIVLLVNAHALEYTAQIAKFGMYRDNIQLLNQLPKNITGVSLLSCGVGSIVVLGAYWLWYWSEKDKPF